MGRGVYYTILFVIGAVLVTNSLALYDSTPSTYAPVTGPPAPVKLNYTGVPQVGNVPNTANGGVVNFHPNQTKRFNDLPTMVTAIISMTFSGVSLVFLLIQFFVDDLQPTIPRFKSLHSAMVLSMIGAACSIFFLALYNLDVYADSTDFWFAWVGQAINIVFDMFLSLAIFHGVFFLQLNTSDAKNWRVNWLSTDAESPGVDTLVLFRTVIPAIIFTGVPLLMCIRSYGWANGVMTIP